jgi:chaperonin cofactor prefoldin
VDESTIKELQDRIESLEARLDMLVSAMCATQPEINPDQLTLFD